MTELVLQIQSGNVALPAKLRNRYKLEEGDALTLLDLGGAFILSPKKTVVSELASKLEKIRKTAGLSLADLREGLDEQRRIYAKQKYGINPPASPNPKASYRRRRPGRGRVLHDRS